MSVQEGLFPEPEPRDLSIGTDHVLRSAHLSDDGRYRWTLSRSWSGDATDQLTFVMLNPSTADASIDDPTIRKCVGFAARLGYGGIVVVNLFPWRATKPADLWRAERDRYDITGGWKGDSVLIHALAGFADRPVAAAWGANVPNDHPRVKWLLDQPGAERLHALSVTKRGEPGHPLMLPYSCQLTRWAPCRS